MSDTPPQVVVHGQCKCGRTYRVVNARAGARVACPACGAPIQVSDRAFARALAFAHIEARAKESPQELLEAVPVDYGQLRLAPRGSRVGLTSKRAYIHGDAALAEAMGTLGAFRSNAANESDGLGLDGAMTAAPRGPAALWHGLLLTPLLGLSWRNARTVALMSLCMGLLIAPMILSVYIRLLPGRMILFGGALALLALALLASFLWSVLTHTANGGDDVPLWTADWNWLDDAALPLLWLLLAAMGCWFPWVLVGVLTQVFGGSPALAKPFEWMAWALWPATVMAVGTGGPWTILRPDRLLLGIWRILPPYAAVLATTQLLLLGWEAARAPLAGSWYAYALDVVAAVYAGFVILRMVGLLHRHCYRVLPWNTPMPGTD